MEEVKRDAPLPVG